MVDNNNKQKKSSSKFVTFLKGLFVNNIGLKIFAVLFAVVVGVIIMGLTPIA